MDPLFEKVIASDPAFAEFARPRPTVVPKTNPVKSNNLGNSANKCEYQDLPYDVFLDIWFVDLMNGWTIGLYYDDDAQYHDIYYTDNGGETWTRQHVNGIKRSMFFTDPNNGWAVGGELVYKTTNGGGAFDVPEVKENPILSLTPNPCSGAARLRYQISDIGYLVLDLYSISGLKIGRLLNEMKMPGMYDMEMDLNDLPAGIYLLQHKTLETTITQKLIKF